MRGLSYRRNQHSIKRNARIKRFYNGPTDKHNFSLDDILKDHEKWHEYKEYRKALKAFEDRHSYNKKKNDTNRHAIVSF